MTLFSTKKTFFIFLIGCQIILPSSNSYGQVKPTLKIPIGHQQTINSVAFSQDGKLVATGSGDNTFIIWDAVTGYEIRKVNAGAPVQKIIFSPDASFVITATGQNEAQYASVNKLLFKKWDTKTGKMLAQFPFTGLPDIKFLSISGNLLVPGYSDDLTKKQQSDLDKIDLSDPDKMLKQFTGTINYDSLEKDADKKVEEAMKGMGKIDYNDPKAVEKYTRELMDKMMKKSEPANPLAKGYVFLDPKSFKPVGQLNRSFEKPQIFTYNNKEYLLAPEYIMSLTSKQSNWINIWPLQDLLSTTNKNPEPWKKFPVKREPNHIAVAQAKGFFASDSGKLFIRLWQLDKTDPLVVLKPTGEIMNNLEFSSDGNILYAYTTTYKTRYIDGWNTSTLQQVTAIQLPANTLGYRTNLSPNGDYFAVENKWDLLKITPYGDANGDYKGHSASPGYYGFSPGDKQLYTNYYGVPDMSEYILLSMEAGVEYEAYLKKQVLTKEEKDKQVKERMRMIPQATAQNYNGCNLVWDLVHGGVSYQQAGAFSTDHKTVSADKNYELANEAFESGGKESNPFVAKMMGMPLDGVSKETADKLKKYQDPNGLYFKTMFASQFNGPATLLINKRSKDTISLIKIDSLDWIMTLKNGYYMTSKNGAKALSYVSGLQVFPFEQFDIKYNRPDLVLKAIGMSDPALIDAYRNAYQKRIKKLDIDTTQFNNGFEVPEAIFTNKDKIPHDQKTNKLKLDIAGSDTKNKLDRFNIWVNEVPVFGKKGKSLKESKSNKLNTTIEITLSQGMNRIETSVVNANGVESYRSPLFVKYIPDKPASEKLHFVGIGIDQFADNKYNLQYSSKDIRDMAKKLKEKYGEAVSIDTLFNESVTWNNVKALKKKLETTTEDDKVIIAYSGHGLLSKDYDYYLSTYNINFEKPEQNGLPYEELENLVDGIPARKKLMLIDACHSGEVDKDDLVRLNASPDSLIKGLKPIAYKKEGQLGLANSFELMQNLFVNVGKSTGAVIISAAAGTQFALERNDLKNGVFTYSILEAMKKYPTIKISELKTIVSKRVEELTKGLQKPTSRNETIAVDWNVW